MRHYHIEEILAILWLALSAMCWKFGYLWLAIPSSALGLLAAISSFVIRYEESLNRKKAESAKTNFLHTYN